MSPHRYLTDKFNVHKGDIVADVEDAEKLCVALLTEEKGILV